MNQPSISPGSDPNSSNNIISAGPQGFDRAAFNIARDRFRQNDFQQAEELVKVILKAELENRDANLPLRVSAWQLCTEAALAQGNFDLAASTAQRGINALERFQQLSTHRLPEEMLKCYELFLRANFAKGDFDLCLAQQRPMADRLLDAQVEPAAIRTMVNLARKAGSLRELSSRVAHFKEQLQNFESPESIAAELEQIESAAEALPLPACRLLDEARLTRAIALCYLGIEFQDKAYLPAAAAAVLKLKDNTRRHEMRSFAEILDEHIKVAADPLYIPRFELFDVKAGQALRGYHEFHDAFITLALRSIDTLAVQQNRDGTIKALNWLHDLLYLTDRQAGLEAAVTLLNLSDFRLGGSDLSKSRQYAESARTVFSQLWPKPNELGLALADARIGLQLHLRMLLIPALVDELLNCPRDERGKIYSSAVLQIESKYAWPELSSKLGELYRTQVGGGAGAVHTHFTNRYMGKDNQNNPIYKQTISIPGQRVIFGSEIVTKFLDWYIRREALSAYHRSLKTLRGAGANFESEKHLVEDGAQRLIKKSAEPPEANFRFVTVSALK